MLSIKCLFRQFQRYMVQLITERFCLDLLSLRNQDNHLWNTSIALAHLEKDIRQRRRRNDLQAQKITIKTQCLLLVSCPENDFRDANGVFHGASSLDKCC